MAVKSVFFSLLLATGLAGVATAENSDAPAEQVKRLLRSAIEESKKNHDYGTQILIQHLDNLEGRNPIVVNGIGPMRTEPAEYQITAIIDEIEILSRSPQIQTDCHALRPKLRADMEAQDALLASKIRQGIADALKQALEARNAKDLDAPLAALDKLFVEGRIHGEDKANAASEEAQYYGPNLVRRLQDVLSTADKPNRLQWYRLYPLPDTTGCLSRAEYVDRFSQFLRNNHFARHYDFNSVFHERLSQLIRSIASPSDISKALEQLDELKRFDGNSASNDGIPILEAIEILKGYQQIYLDLTQGHASKIDVSTTAPIRQIQWAFTQKEGPPEPLTSNRADIGHELVRLRTQLVLLASPRMLGLTQPADAEETIPSYLQRIANEARQNSDWNLLLRVLEMKQTLRIGVAPETVDSVGALRSFIAGLNQEQAHDYLAATQSFLAVLQTGAQVPPAELVGGHLGRLSGKHSQEFQQAMGPLMNPPADPNAGQYSISYLIRQQAMQRPKATLPQPPAILTVPSTARAK